MLFEALLVGSLLSAQVVVGDFNVSIRVLSYSNPNNLCQFCRPRLSQASCCRMECRRCNSRFSYCIYQQQKQQCINSTLVTSNVNLNDAEIDFSSSELLGLPNPLVLASKGSLQNKAIRIGVDQTRRELSNKLIDEFIIDLGSDLVGEVVEEMLDGEYNISSIAVEYGVLCAANWSGENCQNGPCFGVDCNNGECNSSDGTCTCDDGYTGETCDLVDPCHNVSCGTNGKCEGSDGTCTCRDGYTGETCDLVDLCHDVSCGTNGECEGSNGTCICHVGFTGETCNLMDHCHNVSCGTGGKCENLPTSFTCVCPEDATGEFCESKNHCFGVECAGGGECVNEGTDFSCVCDVGLTGRLCDEISDHCFKVDCGRGTCVNQGDSFECVCDPGFMGAACQLTDYCHASNCTSRGKCLSQADGFACTCDPGYTGQFCQLSISGGGRCENVSCSERGRCVGGEGGYYCVCEDGFSGNTCEEVSTGNSASIIIWLKWVVLAAGVLVGVVLVLVGILVAVICRRRQHTKGTSGVTSWGDKGVTVGVTPTYMVAEPKDADADDIYDQIGDWRESKANDAPLPGRGQDPEDYQVPIVHSQHCHGQERAQQGRRPHPLTLNEYTANPGSGSSQQGGSTLASPCYEVPVRSQRSQQERTPPSVVAESPYEVPVSRQQALQAQQLSAKQRPAVLNDYATHTSKLKAGGKPEAESPYEPPVVSLVARKQPISDATGPVPMPRQQLRNHITKSSSMDLMAPHQQLRNHIPPSSSMDPMDYEVPILQASSRL